MFLCLIHFCQIYILYYLYFYQAISEAFYFIRKNAEYKAVHFKSKEKKFFLKNLIIRNGNIVWKHEQYCSYFRLNLKYLRWPYTAYIKTANNGSFCKELLSENGFEADLTTLCCHYHCSNASEALQKIKKSITNAPRVL